MGGHEVRMRREVLTGRVGRQKKYEDGHESEDKNWEVMKVVLGEVMRVVWGGSH